MNKMEKLLEKRDRRIMEYLMDWILDLDGRGLIITDLDEIEKRINEAKKIGFPSIKSIIMDTEGYEEELKNDYTE